jgi:hypothetical protein
MRADDRPRGSDHSGGDACDETPRHPAISPPLGAASPRSKSVCRSPGQHHAIAGSLARVGLDVFATGAAGWPAQKGRIAPSCDAADFCILAPVSVSSWIPPRCGISGRGPVRGPDADGVLSGRPSCVASGDCVAPGARSWCEPTDDGVARARGRPGLHAGSAAPWWRRATNPSATRRTCWTPGAPSFEPGRYGNRQARDRRDGWETRAPPSSGHDWVIVRPGAPGIVTGITVDTSFFTGSHPEQCAVHACGQENYPGPP